MLMLHVKPNFSDFRESPEIADYADYKTITPIANTLKIEKNPCNLILGTCVIKRAKVVFQGSHSHSPGGKSLPAGLKEDFGIHDPLSGLLSLQDVDCTSYRFNCEPDHALLRKGSSVRR